jgi:hypothetical protein
MINIITEIFNALVRELKGPQKEAELIKVPVINRSRYPFHRH